MHFIHVLVGAKTQKIPIGEQSRLTALTIIKNVNSLPEILTAARELESPTLSVVGSGPGKGILAFTNRLLGTLTLLRPANRGGNGHNCPLEAQFQLRPITLRSWTGPVHCGKPGSVMQDYGEIKCSSFSPLTFSWHRACHKQLVLSLGPRTHHVRSPAPLRQHGLLLVPHPYRACRL